VPSARACEAFAEGASFPVTFPDAYIPLTRASALIPGTTVLVYAGPRAAFRNGAGAAFAPRVSGVLVVGAVGFGRRSSTQPPKPRCSPPEAYVLRRNPARPTQGRRPSSSGRRELLRAGHLALKPLASCSGGPCFRRGAVAGDETPDCSSAATSSCRLLPPGRCCGSPPELRRAPLALVRRVLLAPPAYQAPFHLAARFRLGAAASARSKRISTS